MISENKNCFICEIRNNCFFSALSSKDKETFNAHKQSLTLKKGNTVFKENAKANDVFIINGGMVRLVNYYPQKNKEYTISIPQIGNIIGIESLIENNRYHTTAIAINDLSVCRFNRTYLYQPHQKNHEILDFVLKTILKNYSELICSMETIGKDKAEIRLLKVVNLLSKNNASPEKRKVMIKQEELANLSNISRETVSRTLSKYKKNKLMQFKDGELVILDFQKLNTILKSASF